MEDGPWDLVASPNMNRIYVADRFSNTESVIEESTDRDDDGIPDAEDSCPYVYNPGQLNTDAAYIDKGPVMAGGDITVPNGDTLGDA